LIIEAERYRTQEQNDFDSIEGLINRLQKALKKPKITHPCVAAKAARVGEKKKHGEIKRIRRYLPEDWE